MRRKVSGISLRALSIKVWAVSAVPAGRSIRWICSLRLVMKGASGGVKKRSAEWAEGERRKVQVSREQSSGRKEGL